MTPLVRALSTPGLRVLFFFFFFNDTATTEIYTLSLHDALPISLRRQNAGRPARPGQDPRECARSEEHTSELQSRLHLVCRLLLEKKKHKHLQSHGERKQAVSRQRALRAGVE